MGQYCFALWRLSSSVTLHGKPAGGFTRAGQAMTSRRLQSDYSFTVTLHGGPVVLRPVRATPCLSTDNFLLRTARVIFAFLSDNKLILISSYLISELEAPDIERQRVSQRILLRIDSWENIRQTRFGICDTVGIDGRRRRQRKAATHSCMWTPEWWSIPRDDVADVQPLSFCSTSDCQMIGSRVYTVTRKTRHDRLLN